MDKGSSFPFRAIVSAEGGADESVIWSIAGANSSSTKVNDGLLEIAADETATTITLTATSVFNSSIKGSAVITIKATGIDSPSLSDLKVYPNPFVNYVKVANAEGATLRIVNLSGKTVLTQRILTADETVNAAALPAGAYILHLTKDSDTVTAKVLKK